MMGTKWKVAVAALTLLSMVACGGEEKKDAPPEKQAIKPMAVETMTVGTRAFTKFIEFPGVAEPVETRRVGAESSGRILTADFEEGGQVKKGQLLLRTDAKITKAQIRLVDSQLRTATREYNRVKELASQGLATPQQLDQARSQVEQTRLSRAQIKAGAAGSTVRSPFSGYVATKFVEKGEFIGPGQPIAELIDYATIVLKVTVPEADISYIKVGDEVEVFFPASRKSYQGKVAKRGLRVVQPTQTFPVEVQIANAELELVPGMRARVRIPKLTMPNAVVVPRDAILEGFSQQEAMVVRKDGSDALAALRVVELGPSRGNDVVITKGLTPGDKLIVSGHRSVVDGTLLRIVRELDAKAPAAAPEKKAAPGATKEEKKP